MGTGAKASSFRASASRSPVESRVRKSLAALEGGTARMTLCAGSSPSDKWTCHPASIARNARAGNWLSPGEARKFILLLRLYDTSLDVEAKASPDSFPKIVKLKCA